MQIIKKINTSAALALDSTGKEVVVMGKGIGFPPVPYELTDLSVIERSFYNVEPRYLGMIAELPQPILMASADIAEQAELELDCPLKPEPPLHAGRPLEICDRAPKKWHRPDHADRLRHRPPLPA